LLLPVPAQSSYFAEDYRREYTPRQYIPNVEKTLSVGNCPLKPPSFWFPPIRFRPTFASQLSLFAHISVQPLFPENRAQISRILINLHPFPSNSAHIPVLCQTTHGKKHLKTS